MGSQRFITLYLISGIGGALLSFVLAPTLSDPRRVGRGARRADGVRALLAARAALHLGSHPHRGALAGDHLRRDRRHGLRWIRAARRGATSRTSADSPARCSTCSFSSAARARAGSSRRRRRASAEIRARQLAEGRPRQHPRGEPRGGGPHPGQDQRVRAREPHAAGAAVPVELRSAGRPKAGLTERRSELADEADLGLELVPELSRAPCVCAWRISAMTSAPWRGRG